MSKLYTTAKKLFLISASSRNSFFTTTRLRLHLPDSYQEEPVISRIISDFGLIVNITGAMLGEKANGKGCLDIELQGKASQISKALSYLESLELKIVGKSNTAGDSWYC